MYLSNLKLWNFRRYGSGNNNLDLENPDLNVNFTSGLNVLIGENDSGKTAIIDAIKLILKTHSWEWIRVDFDDFFNETTRLRIECRFDCLSDPEAKNFIEWLGMEGEGENAKPYLRVILDASRTADRVLPFEIRAGVDDEGYALSAEAKDYLKTTYLKPLRDAKSELIPRKNSRLSQILIGHQAFKDSDDSHYLMVIFKNFREEIEKYFKDESQDGEKIKKTLEGFLKSFFGKDQNTNFLVTDQKLKSILEALKLTLDDERVGLGSHNLLFIATELLNLEREDWCGLRLALIEELEAHLHPQAQLRVIEFLQEEASDENQKIQLIMTTHSPNLGSKVKLENLIICEKESANVFPMGSNYTKLKRTDYKFLERFLDVTKANLFFAKGVILVEGWAEEILLPVIADSIGIDLTAKGISIVNIGNTAFLRYSKIFQRNDGPIMNIPVAVITDLDIKPEEEAVKKEQEKARKEKKYDGAPVKTFVSDHWTLEYCIALSNKLRKPFFKSVLLALKEQKEDNGVQNLENYENAIENIDTHFNNWQDDNIALTIYYNIVKEKKILELCKEMISKAIIAQHFAKILKECEVHLEGIENEESIKYFMDAIKYAARENTDNR